MFTCIAWRWADLWMWREVPEDALPMSLVTLGYRVAFWKRGSSKTLYWRKLIYPPTSSPNTHSSIISSQWQPKTNQHKAWTWRQRPRRKRCSTHCTEDCRAGIKKRASHFKGLHQVHAEDPPPLLLTHSPACRSKKLNTATVHRWSAGHTNPKFIL